jgi:hypothetical protein
MGYQFYSWTINIRQEHSELNVLFATGRHGCIKRRCFQTTGMNERKEGRTLWSETVGLLPHSEQQIKLQYEAGRHEAEQLSTRGRAAQ